MEKIVENSKDVPVKTNLATRLLTVLEASAATRLSKSKIYQLLDQGILHRVRLPGCSKVLISEDEVRRYIEEGVQVGSTSTIGADLVRSPRNRKTRETSDTDASSTRPHFAPGR